MCMCVCVCVCVCVPSRIAMGNVHGRTPAAMSPPGVPALMLGSHFDTVRDGGLYDGAIGVVAAISALKAILMTVKELQFPIEVIGFGDEEGTRFYSSMLGSRTLIGTMDIYNADGKPLTEGSELERLVDADGVTLKEAMIAGGLKGTAEDVAASAIRPEDVYRYVELHIEQGPVLESENLPIGIVSSIIGNSGKSLFVIKGK